MKTFILEEILILSMREKSARQIKFHPKTTVILGDNSTGKSSLLKTIYWTFGAEPAVTHPDWKKLEITSLVKFSLEGEKYSILRTGKVFGLFDGSGNLISRSTSITKELAPELGKLFDFNVKIMDRNGVNVIPSPAYYFLPFCIDQDVSWGNAWCGFDKLNQISRWKTPVIDYLVGLKNSEYYTLKSEKDSISLKMQELNSERNIYEKTLEEIMKDDQYLNMDFDIEDFKKEIEELVNKTRDIQQIEAVLQSSLVELHNQRNDILAQISIVKKASEEASADYNFALSNDGLDCPTCGQNYHNSFAERFSIAQDGYRCNELLTELNLEHIEIDKKITNKEMEFDKNHTKFVDLTNILSKKKTELTFGEVIKSEGKKQMRSFVKEKLSNLILILGGYESEIKKIEKQQKSQAKLDKIRKSQIEQTYLEKMKESLSLLNVTNLAVDSYKDIKYRINETGNEKSRTLLAYYFSILSVMSKFSSVVLAPVIIDSPKQQDPDRDNWKRTINFVKNQRIDGQQMVLSASDVDGVKFDGEVIEFKEKRKLLSKDSYNEIFKMVNPSLEKMLLDKIKI